MNKKITDKNKLEKMIFIISLISLFFITWLSIIASDPFFMIVACGGLIFIMNIFVLLICTEGLQ